MRQAGHKGTFAMENIEAMRRANPRPRVNERHIEGDMVDWWRTPDRSSKVLAREEGWHGPGLVVRATPSRLLVFHAGGILDVTPAQCRRWSTDEKDMLRQCDSLLKLGREQNQSRRQLGYRDMRGAGCPTLDQYNTPPAGGTGPVIFGAPAPPAPNLSQAPDAEMLVIPAPTAAPSSGPTVAADMRPGESLPGAVSRPETEQREIC